MHVEMSGLSKSHNWDLKLNSFHNRIEVWRALPSIWSLIIGLLCQLCSMVPVSDYVPVARTDSGQVDISAVHNGHIFNDFKEFKNNKPC